MVRSVLRLSLAAALLAAMGGVGAVSTAKACDKCRAKRAAHAGCKSCKGKNGRHLPGCRENTHVTAAARNGLFYNHYAAPACGGVPAKLYLSPRPAPELVGHTYITYEPLMPHEFLYHHHRTYYSYDPGRRVPSNVTRVWWMW